MKPRSPIPQMSEKKLKALGGRAWSTISKRSESPRKRKDKATDKQGWTKKALPSVANQKQEPRTRIRPTNPARKAREFKRAYHSKERVEFVKSLPCGTCRVSGFSENAHLRCRSGMGRKGPYTQIVPFCGSRPGFIEGFTLIGCHKLYDRYPRVFAARFGRIDLARLAAETEWKWLDSLHTEVY